MHCYFDMSIHTHGKKNHDEKILRVPSKTHKKVGNTDNFFSWKCLFGDLSSALNQTVLIAAINYIVGACAHGGGVLAWVVLVQ